MIDAVSQLSTDRGAEFAMFIVPEELQIEAHWRAMAKETWPGIGFNVQAPVQRIQKFADEHGISVLDLAPAFEAVEEEKTKNASTSFATSQ